jgi:hypothetical protein
MAVYDEHDIRMGALLLHPDYLIDAAKYHGGGNPMYGAETAAFEVRRMLRNLARGILARQRRKLRNDLSLRKSATEDIRLACEILKLWTKGGQLSPLEATNWRRTSAVCGPPGEPWMIYGQVDVPVPPLVQDDTITRATLRCASDMLVEHPEWNRAYLWGVHWQRHTPEVVLFPDMQNERIVAISLFMPGQSDAEARATMMRSFRVWIQLVRHPLNPVGQQLAQAWLSQQLIVSIGGVTVSPLLGTGIHRGNAPCLRALGIPIALMIGDRQPNHTGTGEHLTLGVTLDHRCFDGSQGGQIQAYLKKWLPVYCLGQGGGTWQGSSSSVDLAESAPA